MYSINDKVIYGSSGVCVITELCTRDISREEKGKLFYKLRPTYGSETIYAPVDTKAFMRPIMTRAEAEELVARIPLIEPQICASSSITALRQQYDAFFRDHSCEQYISLIKGVRLKAERTGKKLGQTDQRYLKRAEDNLYSELAASLDMDPARIPEYIRPALEQN